MTLKHPEQVFEMGVEVPDACLVGKHFFDKITEPDTAAYYQCSCGAKRDRYGTPTH